MIDAVHSSASLNGFVLTHGGAEVFDVASEPVQRAKVGMQASAFLVDKGNHRHFMAREIHEQPEVVARTLAHYVDMPESRVRLPFDCLSTRRG